MLTRNEQDGALRTFENGGRDFAEEQRFTWSSGDPHHDQVVAAEACLPQDGILGREINAHRGSERHAIPFCESDDVPQDLSFAPSRLAEAPSCLLATGAGDMKRHRWGVRRPRQGEPDFGSPS